MRKLALGRKKISFFGCAALCLLGVPRPVRGPDSLLPPVGKQVCRLNLGSQTPAKPQPNECWSAVATWYGSAFNGQQTASGGAFNMYGLTAAHRSLPLGSVVRVSNPKTGKSTVVTINDRGPFVPGRGLDVSYEVARLLGFAEQGVCRVQIELLKLPTAPWLNAQARD